MTTIEPTQSPVEPPIVDSARSQVGILLVHGMGEQERGDTISQTGDVLTEWLRRWLEGGDPPGDLKIASATLRTPSTDPAEPESASARATISIQRPPENKDDDPCAAPLETRQWRLRESWWAQSFRPATFTEVVGWLIGVGPWVIAGNGAGIRRRLWTAPLRRPWRWVARAASLLIPIPAALVAALITPFVVLVLILSMIPVPGLSDVMRSLARNLAGSYGDLLVLVRSPIRFAAMAEQVRGDIRELSRSCNHVLVVAHSQGSAISWYAIRREAERLRDLDEVQRKADLTRVDQFISYGQALRKLKVLHDLHQSRGERQAPFAIFATASTALLVLTFFFGIGIAKDVVDLQGDVGAIWSRLLTDPAWTWWLALLLGVMAIQLLLERFVSAQEVRSEADLIKEIGCVRAQFKPFRWMDLWGSADPAPNGPLLRADVPAFGGDVSSYKVRNAASTIFDHVIYWNNKTEFVSAVVFAASALAGPSAVGVADSIPRELVAAARLRDRRVSLLSAGRVMVFAGLLAALYGLRERLPDIGRWLLTLLQDLPILPDWFAKWPPFAQGLVGVVLVVAVSVAVWAVLSWAWSGVVRADERAFFGREEAAEWGRWPLAWAAGVILVSLGATTALSIVLQSTWVVLGHLALTAVGAFFVVVILSAGGRSLADVTVGT